MPLRLGSTSRALADLDRTQAGALISLQDPASEHGAMLTALLVSNTLLELSKLGAARLSLSAFADAAVSTFTQCAPIDGSALVFEVPDVAPVRSSTGNWPGPDHDALFARAEWAGSEGFLTAPIFGSDPGVPIGFLGIAGSPPSLIEAGFVSLAAEQLSSMLGVLADAERLRRAAATTETLALIGSISDNYEEDDLNEITLKLASLPGAKAASLLVEFPRFGGPMFIESSPTATMPIDEFTSQRIDPVDRDGALSLSVFWGPAGAPSDSKFELIADRLWTALGRVEQTARLLSEVETDELTGVGNRRRASRALTQATARAKRTGEAYAVFMMDLDKFKSVNDTYGHEIGDQVLKSFAAAIEDVIRGYDVAARWGGEEFLIVCPSTNAYGAEALARRLLEKTPERCANVLPEEHRQTVSIGIAVCENATTDSLELVRKADAAMYHAKTTGRNRYVVASSAPVIR